MPLMFQNKPYEQAEKNNSFPMIPEASDTLIPDNPY
jgi:hypothetical protein